MKTLNLDDEKELELDDQDPHLASPKRARATEYFFLLIRLSINY